jgi:hypothetical protein
MLVEKLEVVFFVIGMVLGFLIAPQFVIKLVAAEFSQLSIFGVVYALILWGTVVGVCGFATGYVGLKLKKLIATWNDPEV